MTGARLVSLGTLFALAGVLALLAACGGSQARFAGHLEKGKRYIEDGNFQKGGVELRNALQVDPANVEALVLSGKVAEHTGDYGAAVEAYRSALSIDEGSVAARAALARIMVFAGEAPQALDLIAPGLVTHPADPELLTVRAAARLVEQDLGAARRDAEAAHAADPKNENAVAMLAGVLRETGELAMAERLVREAIQRMPTSVDLREILASMEAGAGDHEAAITQMRKVIELRPKELSRRTRLALYLIRAKRLDEAQQVLMDSVKALPMQQEAKLQLVEFLATQRTREQGEKLLREYIADDPDDDQLRLGLGALLQRTGAETAAVSVYREVIERDDASPESLVARNRIATLHVAAGQIVEAQKTIDETLARNPRDLDALTLRGNLALERGDARAAILDLRTVLRDQPAAIMARRALARAHVANGEPGLAEDALREALRAAPADTPTRIDLAQLLVQTGRGGQSVSLLEEAVRQSPTDALAREMLARAYLSNQDVPEARKAVEDLKLLLPRAAIGWYLGGLVAEAEKQTGEARKEYAEALQRQPLGMEMHAALARLDLAAGRGTDSEARLAKLLEAHPDHAQLNNLLGELRLMASSPGDAARLFEKAIAAQPRWALPYRNLANALAARGDRAAAQQVYLRGVQATGYALELAVDLAAVHERQGKPDEAIALYEEMRRRHPRDEIVDNNLAMLLVTYRSDRVSLERAIELTERFTRSDNASLLDTSGWVRLKTGQVDEALRLLERAASRAPESKTIRYHLAMAQIQAGQTDRARSNLELALADENHFSGRDAALAALDILKRRSS